MSKKEFYSKYVEGEGYAVIRRMPDRGEEWVIFYAETPEYAEEQAEVCNVYNAHQRYLKSIP